MVGKNDYLQVLGGGGGGFIHRKVLHVAIKGNTKDQFRYHKIHTWLRGLGE